MKWLWCLLAVPFGLSAGEMAQECRPTASSTPLSKFRIDAFKGVVTDKRTGLMWQRCSLGQTWNQQKKNCEGRPSSWAFEKALIEVDQNRWGGYSNWRLPTVKELKSLVDKRCQNPAINLSLFPNSTSRWYWTKYSGKPNDPDRTLIFFARGLEYSFHKESSGFVRMVREP